MTTTKLNSVKDLKPIIPNTVWLINDDYDLCYSDDDFNNTGKGWYVSKSSKHGTSQLFKTDIEALRAFNNDKLKID